MENETARFALDAGAGAVIEERMRLFGWETGGRLVSAERVGDGNMNMTVRVRAANSSFVLKQARPWVVKYPQIPAPVGRAGVEAAFYAAVGGVAEVSRRMPQLRGFDGESHLLWLEDTGEGGDLTHLYRTGKFTAEECATARLTSESEYPNALRTKADKRAGKESDVKAVCEGGAGAWLVWHSAPGGRQSHSTPQSRDLSHRIGWWR